MKYEARFNGGPRCGGSEITPGPVERITIASVGPPVLSTPIDTTEVVPFRSGLYLRVTPYDIYGLAEFEWQGWAQES